MFSFTYASTSPTRLWPSRVNTSGSGTARPAGFAYDIPHLHGRGDAATISTVATALGQGRTPTFGAARLRDGLPRNRPTSGREPGMETG